MFCCIFVWYPALADSAGDRRARAQLPPVLEGWDSAKDDKGSSPYNSGWLEAFSKITKQKSEDYEILTTSMTRWT